MTRTAINSTTTGPTSSVLIFVGLVITSVLALFAPSPEVVARQTGDVELHAIAPDVWVHVSYNTFQGTVFPANGLVVRDGDGLVLIDTAWGEQATSELLALVHKETGLPVKLAIATHFHQDSLGGAEILAERGIEVLATSRTRRLAEGRGYPVPSGVLEGLDEPGNSVVIGPVEIFYPGAGHAEDNVVVYIRESRVLFGGCAVRSLGTSSLGNTSDADLAQWPHSMQAVLSRFPETEIVVPGHGKFGGSELLEHTIKLSLPAQ